MKKSIKTDLGNKEIFRRNLKRHLEISGKKKIEVARAIGVSSGNFSDWLNGRVYPRMDKIQALAEYFDIQMADLVDDVNIAKETVSDKDQEVLDLFHKVPKEKRELVLSMIRAATDNL